VLNLTSAALKVFLALDPCDMHKSFNGLNTLAADQLHAPPPATPSSSSPTSAAAASSSSTSMAPAHALAFARVIPLMESQATNNPVVIGITINPLREPVPKTLARIHDFI
jgi:hypothetical protein